MSGTTSASIVCRLFALQSSFCQCRLGWSAAFNDTLISFRDIFTLLYLIEETSYNVLFTFFPCVGIRHVIRAKSHDTSGRYIDIMYMMLGGMVASNYTLIAMSEVPWGQLKYMKV